MFKLFHSEDLLEEIVELLLWQRLFAVQKTLILQRLLLLLLRSRTPTARSTRIVLTDACKNGVEFAHPRCEDCFFRQAVNVWQ